jgi:hypothetical protein
MDRPTHGSLAALRLLLHCFLPNELLMLTC